MAYESHGCCEANDDRTRMSSDPSDPKSGRYSLKISIPTALPVWVPVPVLTKHAPGPIQNGSAYTFSLWVRSSPVGVKVYFRFGTLANSTSTTGLRLLGTASRTWMRLGSSFHVPPSAAFVADAGETWPLPAVGRAAPTQAPQLMFVPADLKECGGCKNLGSMVWIDDVTIAKLS